MKNVLKLWFYAIFVVLPTLFILGFTITAVRSERSTPALDISNMPVPCIRVEKIDWVPNHPYICFQE